ncbi:MAG: UbiA family prenyltransferase, partial [Polyangiales bacterium]
MVLAAIHALRPHQWVKNLFVLAPFVFAGQLFALASALRALVAFLLFCLASSAVYVLNDLADIEADRAHPVKCRRPIASGKISPALARGIVFALVSAALGLGLLLGEGFAATVLAYLLLNVAYTA